MTDHAPTRRPRRALARASGAATTAGYRGGWWLARQLPEPLAYDIAHRIADATTRRGGPGVARLRANYAKVRPELGDAELDALVADGMRRYMRYYYEAFRLPSIPDDELPVRVRLENRHLADEALAAGRPVVCFLGHMGNWDLAGAWATRHWAGVVTVAEHLEPESLFRDFLAFRRNLGMTIIALDKGVDVYQRLLHAVAGPVLVPLLADRDLTATGVEVDLCGHQAMVAAGPAALAIDTGGPLFPVSIRHEPRDTGWCIVVTFHDEVPDPGGLDRRARVRTMTQGCASAIGEAIRAHTADWHMMQRVFLEDLDLDRLRDRGTL